MVQNASQSLLFAGNGADSTWSEKIAKSRKPWASDIAKLSEDFKTVIYTGG